MTRRAVNPDTLLSPPGPYSQVVRSADLAFVSGQVGAGADGELVGPGIVEQAAKVISNVDMALDAVGLELADVVKVTIFVAYEDDLGELVPYMDRAFPRAVPEGAAGQFAGLREAAVRSRAADRDRGDRARVSDRQE